jgi:dTDP-4-dehydrorhamnose reductase
VLSRLAPQARWITKVHAERDDDLAAAFAQCRPDVVINAVGVVKQLQSASDPVTAITLNSLLPHRIAALCGPSGARLIHISTDCVFTGARGNYGESDVPDARDLYGRSKLLGEIVDCRRALTLRTSIIGPELAALGHGLLAWFLAQGEPVKGFRRAIFSGLPTVEVARFVQHFVLPRADLWGLYHLASAPINKFDLLGLIAQAYGHSISIAPDDALVIDRSLDGSRLQAATGFVAPAWPEMVRRMRDFS